MKLNIIQINYNGVNLTNITTIDKVTTHTHEFYVNEETKEVYDNYKGCLELTTIDDNSSSCFKRCYNAIKDLL